jgi:hypothetical protein
MRPTCPKFLAIWTSKLQIAIDSNRCWAQLEKRGLKVDLPCLRVLFDLFLGKDFMLVLHCLSIYSFIASFNLDLAKTRSAAALLTKSLTLQDSDKICHPATLLPCHSL